MTFLKSFLAATILFAAAPASATLYFDFAYDGLGIGETRGQLLTTDTATLQADGREAYTIIGITGKRGGPSGDTITGLMPSGVPFDTYGDIASNLLYTSGPLLDYFGFAYTIMTPFAETPYVINTYYSGGDYYEYFCCSGALSYFTVTPGEAPVAAVPEPGVLGLMAGGTGLIALARRRRGGVR